MLWHHKKQIQKQEFLEQGLKIKQQNITNITYISRAAMSRILTVYWPISTMYDAAFRLARNPISKTVRFDSDIIIYILFFPCEKCRSLYFCPSFFSFLMQNISH